MRRFAIFFCALAVIAIVFSSVLCMFAAEETVKSRLRIPVPLEIPADLKNDAVSTTRKLEPIPQLRLIVDPVPVVSAAACPLDATVSIIARDSRKGFAGVGTCVASEVGVSTIITAAHIFDGLNNPEITVTHQRKVYHATLRISERRNDLAVLAVAADLPAVDVSATTPRVGDWVTSIWLKEGDVENLVELGHKITDMDRYGNPRNLETDGQQIPGRSGGGLFFNGELCGVVTGFRHDERKSVYASLPLIRDVLGRSSAVGAVAESTRHVEAELITTTGCVPCNRLKKALGAGNERIRIKVTAAPPGWSATEGGFPYVRYLASDGNEYLWHSIRDLDHLERNIDLVEPDGNAEVAGPVGATIQGRSIIESIIGQLNAIAGDGSTATFRWHREGGKDALLVSGTHTRKDIFGDSGRIELVLKSAKDMPVHAFSFDYRFSNGKFYFRPDEIECEIPEDGCVGAAEPVGSPLLITWTIVSIGYDIYQLLHPTADLFLGKDIIANATLKDSKLAVVFTNTVPRARLHWSFMLGLLKFEYGRDLTGLTLSSLEAVIQFHNSRSYRDVKVPVQ